ncbi:NAD(P)-binding protein [Bdellovibrio sp. HCB209]|uniref:NAD(P)/FAD-dependent oxidoreductase n=1 Tax=Bdellovibrio sp. HCB209 TaxID=3394354 RepID=UPI0039B4BDB7
MAHIYDYAIIGSGLTGLSIAASLSRETKNVVLLEGLDHSGGNNKQINFPTGPINNGIRFVPDSVLSEKALGFLENLLGQKVIADVSDEAPVTYDSGNFKTFLGFGDNPPAFWEELSYFTSSKRIDLGLQPFQWSQLLMEKFTGEFMPRSYVTKFHQEGDRVTSVTVNGSKTIHAQNFIFAGTVRDLSLLLPEDAISVRARSKLAKNAYWTALCLDICHSKAVTDSTAVHVLNGTTQDEIGPCAGRFLPAVEVDGNTIQASQWITFIETEMTDDSETVGMTLKKIKRQIKRAYPEALDDVKLERIFVSPYIAGTGDLKLSANQTIPSLDNLWVASATLNDQKNLVGSLLQAEMIVASLGFKVEETAAPEAPAEEFSEASM